MSIREIGHRLKSISGLIQARYAHELVILDFEKRLGNDQKFAKCASTLVAEAKSSLGEMATLNAITTWIQTERATPIKARASARLFVQRHGGTAPDELKRVIDIMSTCLEQVEKKCNDIDRMDKANNPTEKTCMPKKRAKEKKATLSNEVFGGRGGYRVRGTQRAAEEHPERARQWPRMRAARAC